MGIQLILMSLWLGYRLPLISFGIVSSKPDSFCNRVVPCSNLAIPTSLRHTLAPVALPLYLSSCHLPLRLPFVRIWRYEFVTLTGRRCHRVRISRKRECLSGIQRLAGDQPNDSQPASLSPLLPPPVQTPLILDLDAIQLHLTEDGFLVLPKNRNAR